MILEAQVRTGSYGNFVGWAASSTTSLLPSGFVDPGSIQQAAENAVLLAGVAACDIAFTHVHAMGNPNGDGPEVLGVAEALTAERGLKNQLVLLNHKANFGHSEYASGMTALLSSILALHHCCVPIHVGVTNPIEEIRSNANLMLPVKTPVLLRQQDEMHASISGTSISGMAAQHELVCTWHVTEP